MYAVRIVETKRRGSLAEITDEVRNAVAESGIREGLATVSLLSSSAGIVLTSYLDPEGHEDIIDDFNRIFPARADYKAKGDLWESAARSKASVAGQSVDLIVHHGELMLGLSQGIFLAEYSDPRERMFSINVFGE